MVSLRDAVRDVLGVHEVRGEDEWPSRCFHPAHKDRSPSASVNVEKGVWCCYSCGAGGRLDSLLRGVRIADPSPDRNLEAVEEALSGVLPPREFPESWLGLYLAGDRPDYWRSRFSDPAIDHFGLGFDYESGCPTYPLRSESGALIGLVRRNLDGQGAKYVYPKHIKTHDLLFHWEHWDDERRGPLVLVEGAMDVVALWEAGVFAMGIYGSRLSDRQAKMVSRLYPEYVVCAFDNDSAGRSSTERVKEMLPHMPIYTVPWEDHMEFKDVADMSVQQRADFIDGAVLDI